MSLFVAVMVALAAHAVVAGDQLVTVDGTVWWWWVVHRAEPLTTVATAVTETGSTAALSVIVVSAVAWRGHRPAGRGDAALVAVVGAGAGLLISLFKAAVVRSRPPEEFRLALEATTSFPSGHALGSIAILGVLGSVTIGGWKPTRWRWIAWATLGSFVAVVGLSRVYLGVHWATDVAAGWLIGGCWLLLCLAVRRQWRRRQDQAHRWPAAAPTGPTRSAPHSGPKTVDGPGPLLDAGMAGLPAKAVPVSGVRALTPVRLERKGETKMLARDVMTQPVVTVAETAGVAEASQLLVSRGFTALPVVDEDGRLIGIVTEADLLRGRIPDDPRRLGRPSRRPTTSDTEPPGGSTVAEVMTTPVESLTPGADIADAARMMVEERIRCLPIVDGFGLVGIITRRDLLRAAMTHDDAAVRNAILSRLRAVDPRDRWDVDVSGGAVVIADHVDDPRARQAVGAIAAAVPGVVRADVHYETCDPF